MIYIRVDGNEEIATGHVMRCLSVAEALRELGEDAVFILADDRPADLIRMRGFPVLVLGTVWNDMDTECETLISCIEENEIKKLILDSYFVTRHYLAEIGRHTKLIYIDDRNAFVYPVDMLVNYGFLSRAEHYAEAYGEAGQDTIFLTGCDYIPLRKEFRNTFFEVREKVSDVLITTGGTDLYNVAGNVLAKCAGDGALRQLRFHVVAGRFNRNIGLLRKMGQENPNVMLYENVTNMSELMQRCDIAVTAGGSTTYELCAVGIPSVCLSIAENQREGAKNWEQEGFMLYAGDMQADADACINGVARHLKTYAASRSLRREKSRAMRGLVDGKGAWRLAREIMNFE